MVTRGHDFRNIENSAESTEIHSGGTHDAREAAGRGGTRGCRQASA